MVVSHYPFFSTGFSEINYTDSEESAALIRLFDRHKVRLVLSGHTHKKYMRTIGSTNNVVGEAARVEDSGQKAIRVKINGTSVTTEDFDLP